MTSKTRSRSEPGVEEADVCPRCSSTFTMRTLRAGQTGEVECWACSAVFTVEVDGGC